MEFKSTMRTLLLVNLFVLFMNANAQYTVPVTTCSFVVDCSSGGTRDFDL